MQQTFELPIEHHIVKLNPQVIEMALPQLRAAGHDIAKITRLAVNAENKQTLVWGHDASGAPIEFYAILRLPIASYESQVVFHNRDVPLFTFSQCVAKVIGWSTDRGILENGRWDSQGTKLYEEDGEAATGVGKNKKRLIVDGIGDALVVLVNVLELIGSDAAMMSHIYNQVRDQQTVIDNPHYFFHKMRLHLTQAVDVVYEAHNVESPKRIDKGVLDEVQLTVITSNVHDAINYANLLARVYHYSLEECFSLAWDEIKDRKGFLNADGIFIKEADA